MKEKSELKNVMLGLIKNLKTKDGIQVRYEYFDNAEENEDFEWAWKQEGMGNKFEYTATELLNRMVILNENLPHLSIGYMPCSMVESFFLRTALWVEATKPTNFLENNLLTINQDLSSFQHFFGKGKRSIPSLI